ncbi:MAG: hypothetical protein OXC30_01140 [Alphaproteobacteria bacterium]|nr:hypothetical protein [Alphaproteobacteria bacterium]
MKSIIIACAMLVCQAHSAEQLEKSQTIVRYVDNLQSIYLEGCDADHALRKSLNVLVELAARCKRYSDLSTRFGQNKRAKVEEYMGFARQLSTYTTSFLEEYKGFTDSGEMIFSGLCVHHKGQEGWGNFPNPTRPRKTAGGATYLCQKAQDLYSAFRRWAFPTLDCKGALDAVLRALSDVHNINCRQSTTLSALEEEVDGIDESTNCLLKTYKSMMIASIKKYDKYLMDVDCRLGEVESKFTLDSTKFRNTFSVVECALQDLIQVETMLNEMR